MVKPVVITRLSNSGQSQATTELSESNYETRVTYIRQK